MCLTHAPYRALAGCKLSIGKALHKTATCKGGSAPSWKQTFEFALTNADTFMEISCFHEDSTLQQVAEFETKIAELEAVKTAAVAEEDFAKAGEAATELKALRPQLEAEQAVLDARGGDKKALESEGFIGGVKVSRVHSLI